MPSYFDEDQAAAPGAGQPQEPQGGGDDQQQKDSDQDQQTALVPLSVFPKPPKVGDHCMFEVKALHDEEVSMAYADEQGEEHDQEEEPPAGAGAPPPGPGAMGSMLE
jgi:hypothetical protein